jgi:hypothetical protein
MSLIRKIIYRSVVDNKINGARRPNLPRWLFWEFRYDEMNWQYSYFTVIERILDRGSVEEIEELIRYYGRKRVLRVLKIEPIYLMDHSIERACAYFHLKPEELVCYKRKRSRKGYWI